MAIRKIVSRSIGVDVIAAEDLANNSVTAAEISDGAVTVNKIGSGAVTEAKIGSGAVTTDKIGDAQVSVGKLASSLDLSSNTVTLPNESVTADKLNVGQIGGRRNLIINGAMQVAQRGTSGTLVGGPGYVSLDRWRFYVDTSTTLTISQQSFSPGQTSVDKNLEYFMRFDWLGTGSNTTKTMSQRIEGVNWGQGQQMTLSFYGLSEQADDVTVKVIQNFGSGGSTSVVAEESVIDLTTSWDRYSLTFDMPSIAGKTVGTDPYIIVEFNFGPATLNSYFDVTGVQLELGAVASPFENRSYGEELALCQRYYFKSGGQWMSGQSYGTNNSQDGLIMPIYWPTTMRANPSVTFSGGGDGGSQAALYTAYVQEEGMSVNLRSTGSNTSVWWQGFIVTADSEL